MPLYELKIQFLPSILSGHNARTELDREEWDTVRKRVYSDYDYNCGFCGKHTSSLDAHEVWELTDGGNGLLKVKLVNIIACCPLCHLVVHIGFAKNKGIEENALKQFLKVRGLEGISEEERDEIVSQEIDDATKEAEKWNREWRRCDLDVDYAYLIVERTDMPKPFRHEDVTLGKRGFVKPGMNRRPITSTFGAGIKRQ